MKTMMKSVSSEQGLTTGKETSLSSLGSPTLAQMSGISQAIHPFYCEKD